MFGGVPYAFLWGFLTTVLSFVPYIGSLVAVTFPLILSFAIAPSWTQPILVLVIFGFLDIVTANVIEPLLFGHGTGVSPIALLIAAAFWTWIWGPIGLVLSTPLTVCLVVLGQHVPRLRFFALLLERRGAKLSYSDPHVPVLRLDGLHLDAAPETAAADADCVVIITNHSAFDYAGLLERSRLIVDTRNALKGMASEKIVRL